MRIADLNEAIAAAKDFPYARRSRSSRKIKTFGASPSQTPAVRMWSQWDPV